MGFLDFGSAKGLNFQNDFEKDTDRLYQREAYRAQVQAEKEQKTKYYAGLMKEQPAVSPAMTKLLEGHYKDLNNKIADFAIEHPNFETDVALMQEFVGLTDGYINNEYLRKDQQSQENFKKLQDALNKGDISMDSPEYLSEMDRYTKFQNEGGDPYTYAGYKAETYSDILKRSGNLYSTILTETVDPITKYITRTKGPDEEGLNQRVSTDLADEKSRKVIQKEFDAANKVEGGLRFNSIMEFHKSNLKALKERELIQSDLDAKYKIDYAAQRAAQKAYETSYFADEIGHRLLYGSPIKGNAYLSVFAPFRGEGTKKSMSANVPVKVEKNGALEDIILPYQATLKGSEEMKTMQDGSVWIKNSVYMSVPKDNIKELDNEIWKPTSIIDPGLTGIDFNGGVVKNPLYEGVIWTKAVINSSSLAEYEKRRAGADHATKLQEQGEFELERIVNNATLEGDTQFALAVLNNDEKTAADKEVIFTRTGAPYDKNDPKNKDQKSGNIKAIEKSTAWHVDPDTQFYAQYRIIIDNDDPENPKKIYKSLYNTQTGKLMGGKTPMTPEEIEKDKEFIK